MVAAFIRPLHENHAVAHHVFTFPPKLLQHKAPTTTPAHTPTETPTTHQPPPTPHSRTHTRTHSHYHASTRSATEMRRRTSSARNSFRSAVMGTRTRGNTPKGKLSRAPFALAMESSFAAGDEVALVPLTRRYPDVDGDFALLATAAEEAARAAAASAAASAASVNAAKAAAGNPERVLHHGGQFEKVYPALRGPHERCTDTRRPVYGVRKFGTIEVVRTPPMYPHHQGFRRNYSPGALAARPDTWLMRVREVNTTAELRPSQAPRVVRHIDTDPDTANDIESANDAFANAATTADAAYANSIPTEDTLSASDRDTPFDFSNEKAFGYYNSYDTHHVQTRLDLLLDAPAVEYVPANPITANTTTDAEPETNPVKLTSVIRDTKNQKIASIERHAYHSLNTATRKTTMSPRFQEMEQHYQDQVLRPLCTLDNDALNVRKNINDTFKPTATSTKLYRDPIEGDENSAPIVRPSNLAY